MNWLRNLKIVKALKNKFIDACFQNHVNFCVYGALDINDVSGFLINLAFNRHWIWILYTYDGWYLINRRTEQNTIIPNQSGLILTNRDKDIIDEHLKIYIMDKL